MQSAVPSVALARASAVHSLELKARLITNSEPSLRYATNAPPCFTRTSSAQKYSFLPCGRTFTNQNRDPKFFGFLSFALNLSKSFGSVTNAGSGTGWRPGRIGDFISCINQKERRSTANPRRFSVV